MKTCFKQGFIFAVLGVCLLSLVGWTEQEVYAETEAVKEAFIGSQNISYQIGCFESENGKTDMLSEQEIQTYIDAFNTQMDRYYAKDNICRQTYKEINEQLLREVCRNKVYYSVDAGVLDCVFDDVSLDEEEQTATVKAVCTVWGNWVEENDSSTLNVIAPIERDTITATMVKEDGQWKLGEIQAMTSEFGADIINDVETQEKMTLDANVYAEEQLAAIDGYVEKTYLTEYSSFKEALTAAQSLNPYEINPFELEAYTAEKQ